MRISEDTENLRSKRLRIRASQKRNQHITGFGMDREALLSQDFKRFPPELISRSLKAQGCFQGLEIPLGPGFVVERLQQRTQDQRIVRFQRVLGEKVHVIRIPEV